MTSAKRPAGTVTALWRAPTAITRRWGACGDRSRRPPQQRSHPPDQYIMKASDPKATQELVGIVISGMQRPPQTTVFTAYVWGPAPTTPSENEPKAT
jgi:hypothetical protein